MLKETWMLAIETLSWIEKQRLSESLAFARTVKQLDVRDHNALRLGRKLVSETMRRRNFIDMFINQVIGPDSIEEFTLGVQAFLRLYVYQTRIAKNWSCADTDEAENIAGLARFILGWKTLQKVEPYLGRLLTQEPAKVFEGRSDEETVGLQTFHPTWFVRYCIKLLGRKEAIAMLEANVQPSLTYIRLNTLKDKENRILEALAEDGVILQRDKQLKFTYKVTATQKPLTRTASFRRGLFYIQDKASCFAAEATNLKPGMTVLDVCAGPGAKTTYLAQLMRNKGNIYSFDYSKRRMSVWKSEIARMDAEIAEPIIVDARNSLPLTVKADVAVLDPPCTSTGTFRKLPSAKWRIAPRSIDRMAAIQWQLINSCAEHVKTGGSLIYSTCSITVEENEVLIERFLKWHPDFSLCKISPEIGLQGLRGLTECRRLYPHIHECNGFFLAKLLSRGKG